MDDTEKAKRINNEVWKIILKHLGFFDFVDQVMEPDICMLLNDF